MTPNEISALVDGIAKSVTDRLAITATDTPIAYGERDAARLLGISQRTLYGLRIAGEIRATKVGTRVLYSREDLLAYLSPTGR